MQGQEASSLQVTIQWLHYPPSPLVFELGLGDRQLFLLFL